MAVGRCKLPHSVPLGLPVHEGIAPLTREPTTACPRCRATAPAPGPRQPSEPPGDTVPPRPPRACLAATLGDGCGAVQATTQRAAGTSHASPPPREGQPPSPRVTLSHTACRWGFQCMRASHLSHASPPPRVRAAEPPHPPPPAPRQPSEPPGDTVGASPDHHRVSPRCRATDRPPSALRARRHA